MHKNSNQILAHKDSSNPICPHIKGKIVQLVNLLIYRNVV